MKHQMILSAIVFVAWVMSIAIGVHTGRKRNRLRECIVLTFLFSLVGLILIFITPYGRSAVMPPKGGGDTREIPALDRMSLGAVGVLIVSGLLLMVGVNNWFLNRVIPNLSPSSFEGSGASLNVSVVDTSGRTVRPASLDEERSYNKGNRRPYRAPSYGRSDVFTLPLLITAIFAIYLSQKGFWLIITAFKKRPTAEFYETSLLLPWHSSK